MTRISLKSANLATIATLTPSSADAAYPVANLLTPDRPDIPWKTTAGGDQYVVIDHGSAKTVEAWALLYSNFTSVRIQANATDSWGTPTYNELLTIGTHPKNGRLCLNHRPTAPTAFRYNRIFIPTQTPTDASVYRLGAAWIAPSPISTFPNDPLWDLESEEVEPFEDILTPSLRRQRVSLGPSFWRLAGKLVAKTGPTPMHNDEIATLTALARQWKSDGYALVSLQDAATSQVAVMRWLTTVKGRINAGATEFDFEWEEVT